jgi:hypothetical protein
MLRVVELRSACMLKNVHKLIYIKKRPSVSGWSSFVNYFWMSANTKSGSAPMKFLTIPFR